MTRYPTRRTTRLLTILLLLWAVTYDNSLRVVASEDFAAFDSLALDGDALSESDCDAMGRELTFQKRLAENGITFRSNVTQFYFGTVDGGIDQTDRYGGHGDYVANLDMGKLGIQDGLFVKLRAEHRFGSSVVAPSGVFLPITLATELPTVNDRDLHLTNFLITQAFSENFVVYAGKLDTLDGDVNAFAHGRGITQFSNAAFVANPIALRTIPYASLGAGFAFLREGEPLFSFLLINPTDTATSAGFDELFSNGVAMSTELRLRTNFLQRLGHVLFGGTYSTRDYVTLDQDPRIALPQVPINRATDSWSLYTNTDQYLYQNPDDPSQGWGLFTRAGIGDDETNPISYFLSAGVGGHANIAGRSQDTFGVGYYFSSTSNEIANFLAFALGGVGDSRGVEMFYNFQASKSLTITPDFQWVSPARQSIDDVYVLGVRANLAF